MILSVFLFSCVNAVVKKTTSAYPIVQVVFFRNFWALILLVGWAVLQNRLDLLKPKNILFLGGNGVIGFIGLTSMFYSLKIMPLAESVTIQLSSIFFLTLCSIIFLKEKVGRYRWYAVAFGFLGVVIVMQPTGEFFSPGAIYALIFALCEALVMVNARILTKSTPPLTIVIYYALFSSCLAAVFCIDHGVPPSSTLDFSLLVFLGVGGGIAQLLMTYAYSLAPASLIAPFIFTALVWNGVFGYWFWGDHPTNSLFFGGSLIVLSGLFIIFRENKTKPTYGKV